MQFLTTNFLLFSFFKQVPFSCFSKNSILFLLFTLVEQEQLPKRQPYTQQKSCFAHFIYTCILILFNFNLYHISFYVMCGFFLLNHLSISFLHLCVLLDAYYVVYENHLLSSLLFHHIFHSISTVKFLKCDISYIHTIYLHNFYTFLRHISLFLLHVVNIYLYFLILCYTIIHK